MKRRDFTKVAGLSAIAITQSGFIHYNGKKYVGDCETTSDILGPFYRPDSPVRNNLVIEGETGKLVELSGTIRHKDCATPYKNAKIELWHCSSNEIYDNDSDEFRYRGTSYCDENGFYKFTTQMPVPYDAGGGNYRPAHFHILVTAEGYQNLVTQIYFTGDPYLESDPYAAGAKSNRILDVKEKNGMIQVAFDVNMNDVLLASPAALDEITGTYQNTENDRKIELFKSQDYLWRKNEVYGVKFNYIGDNTFHYEGMPDGMQLTYKFKIEKDNNVTLLVTSIREDGKKRMNTFKKI